MYMNDVKVFRPLSDRFIDLTRSSQGSVGRGEQNNFVRLSRRIDS
jgi:hypothetical protein